MTLGDDPKVRAVFEQWFATATPTSDRLLGIDQDEADEWKPDQVVKDWHKHLEHDRLPDATE